MKLFKSNVFPVLFGLVIYVSIRLVTDVYSTEQFWNRYWQVNAVEILFSLLATFLMVIVFRSLIKKFNTAYPVLKPANIIREFVIVLVVVAIMLNIVVWMIHYVNADPITLADVVIANIIVGLYALLYYAIVRGNNYIRSYIEQQTQLERLKTENLEAELNFLKAQYHPHFIFNALNTIYFQMDESVPDAKKTVEKFSELLRYQLYDHQQMIPLNRELEHLDNYIHLQKQRANDQLDLQVYYSSDIGQQKIYPLLLLPLVENAFKYVGGSYRIVIEARRDGEVISFTVQNSLPDCVAVKGGGIGLVNLRKRLQLLYNNKHCFSVEHTKYYYKAELKLSI
jgi:LytS/YehU family sensor histidine kinase